MFKNNETKNAKDCVNKIIDIYLHYCHKKYDLVCTSDDVIILESGDEKKVSYHLIFKKVVFANIMHCKSFIQCVLEQVSNSDISILTAFDKNLKSKLIIDLAVYNKGGFKNTCKGCGNPYISCLDISPCPPKIQPKFDEVKYCLKIIK